VGGGEGLKQFFQRVHARTIGQPKIEQHRADRIHRQSLKTARKTPDPFDAVSVAFRPDERFPDRSSVGGAPADVKDPMTSVALQPRFIPVVFDSSNYSASVLNSTPGFAHSSAR
jgi:hypothetical protein